LRVTFGLQGQILFAGKKSRQKIQIYSSKFGKKTTKNSKVSSKIIDIIHTEE
jgi:hypothetical protein